MAPVVGVVNVLFVESRAPAVGGGGVLGDFPFFRGVMALDGLVSSAVTGHLQAVYKPRDIVNQCEPVINQNGSSEAVSGRLHRSET